MIVLKDKTGQIVAEVDEKAFPLEMPVAMRSGERIYYLRIFYEEDGTPRSALLNTKK